MRLSNMLLALIGLGISSTPSAAVVVSIDFESLAHEAEVGDSFADLGVVFVNAQIFDISVFDPTATPADFPGASFPRTIAHETRLGDPVPGDPISAFFARDVSKVSITGVDVGFDGFRLAAFDLDGQLIEAETAVGTTLGGVREFFTLEIIAPGIRRVDISQIADTNGPNDGASFDNLVFAITPVPVPFGFPLLLTGLAGLAVLRWTSRAAAKG